MNIKVNPTQACRSDYIINKRKLIKKFNESVNIINLAKYEDFKKEKLDFFKNNIEEIGIYCLYNKNSVMYVGKSKRLKDRIKEQFIGSKDGETGRLKFSRLFLGVLKEEKNIGENIFNDLLENEKKKKVEEYLHIIYNCDNYLKIHFTKDHVQALVLEETLINYFQTDRGQCKYNAPPSKRETL
jgi:hypothetical protein